MLFQVPAEYKSGIYAISNVVNGHLYVGSAVDFRQRYRQHKHDLIQGKHRNQILQKAWRKYGSASFTFSLLEEVKDTALLLSVEQMYLDKYIDTSSCYNIARIASSTLGLKRSPESIEKWKVSMRGKPGPRLGVKLEASTKKKLSDSHFGLKNNLGTVYSDETKMKISEAKKGRSIVRKKHRVTFQTPSGEMHEKVTDIKNFAKAQKLNPDGLYRLIKGEYTSYHGWVILSIEAYGKNSKTPV